MFPKRGPIMLLLCLVEKVRRTKKMEILGKKKKLDDMDSGEVWLIKN